MYPLARAAQRTIRGRVRIMTAGINIDISAPCEHLEQTKIRHVQRPGAGCVDCLKIGGSWVHLRECLSCGHVACCDSSPNRHATKHFLRPGIRS
jgi:hypothetical protein